MWQNAARRFPAGTASRALRLHRTPALYLTHTLSPSLPLCISKLGFPHTTACPLQVTDARLYVNTGKYDPQVRVRPEQFPILCTPLYNDVEDDWGWDAIQNQQEEASVLSGIIAYDDVPALREMLRFMGPELLYWDIDPTRYSPPMIEAAEIGSVRVFEALLDYRDNPLTPEHREAMKEAQEAYEWNERFEGCDIARPWGTPLTQACKCAQVDVVRLLLDRMPEVDINACDKLGYTPLQAVARHSDRTAQTLNNRNHKESMRRIAIVRLLLAYGANKKPPDTSFERVGQTVLEALDKNPDHDDPENNLRPLVYRPGGGGNALIMALTRPAGVDVLLTRMLIDEVGIDVHEGYFFATAAFDGKGHYGIADDVDVDGFQLDRDAAHKKFSDDFKEDRAATFAALHTALDAANVAERLLAGPGQGPDTYLTPLAAAALFRNPEGVAALLKTPGTDFYKDLISPSIPAHMSNVGDATVTAMRPLHAVMIGRRYEDLRIPSICDPGFNRGGELYSDVHTAEARAAVRERDGLPDDPPDRKLEIQVAKELFANEDGLQGRFRHVREDEAARKTYLDDCVATVKLLTADPAVCVATVNSTHLHDGMHYTPLHLGARFDRLPMLRVLLDAGADPKPPVPHTGRSVFFSVFASLLRMCSGTARCKQCDWGWAGIDKGSYRDEVVAIDGSIGTADMTRLLRDLLGSDADVNEADPDGNTALHWAMGYDLPHAQAALLALGARLDVRNSAGEAPTKGTPPTTTRLTKYTRYLE